MVNVVLEIILVYLMVIAHIPKSILTKIKKTYFNFLLIDKREKERIPLVKWSKVANLKEVGGWGFKNIFLFSKALVEKVCWRLILVSSLWS